MMKFRFVFRCIFYRAQKDKGGTLAHLRGNANLIECLMKRTFMGVQCT